MNHNTVEDKMPSVQAVPLILTFCSISAMFMYLIYSKNLVFGSTIGGWVFPYFETIHPIPLWIPPAVLILLGVMIFAASRLIHKREKLTLVACFAIAVVIQILMQKIYPIQMDSLIVSVETNSFYSAAKEYPPFEVLSGFQDGVESLPGHAKTNMPGKILLFHLLSAFTSSPQVMGYMIIAISALGGVILYGICKHLFHDKTLALYAFVLYTLIPSKQLFFPILNTVTPVFILLCLYLLLVYLGSKKVMFLVLLGIALYFLVLFEPSPLVTGLLFVGVLVHAIGQKQVNLKEVISVILVPIISFAAIHIFFVLFFSYDLFQSLQYMIKDAVEFNAKDNRSYLVWIKENLKEFFYGVGLPTMMVFIYAVIQNFSQWRNIRKNILNWSIENIYVLSLLITFIVVLGLGINRGETTRLWIYLAVFFQIPAAFFLGKAIRSNTLVYLLSATLAAQTMLTLQRVMFLSK